MKNTFINCPFRVNDLRCVDTRPCFESRFPLNSCCLTPFYSRCAPYSLASKVSISDTPSVSVIRGTDLTSAILSFNIYLPVTGKVGPSVFAFVRNYNSFFFTCQMFLFLFFFSVVFILYLMTVSDIIFYSSVSHKYCIIYIHNSNFLLVFSFYLKFRPLNNKPVIFFNNALVQFPFLQKKMSEIYRPPPSPLFWRTYSCLA